MHVSAQTLTSRPRPIAGTGKIYVKHTNVFHFTDYFIQNSALRKLRLASN